jgi:L-threonylcarbamoyladenylate synthase
MGNVVNNLELVVAALQQGEVIAYPTEGVFGVGCDPDNPRAIEQLLHVKQRSVEKGLILIAADFEQLKPYLDLAALSEEQLQRVMDSWPGPVTWIIPASPKTSAWVTGQFNSVAVRVTDHPLAQQLCLAFGKPLTSTSANLSGLPACMTSSEVREQLGSRGVTILEGLTGGRNKPSEIRDALTLQVLRQG